MVSCFSLLFPKSQISLNSASPSASSLLLEKAAHEKADHTTIAAPDDSTARLSALRALMKEEEIDAYVVPTADAHGSEYVGACDARRSFLSGFTGSAGTAVVTLDSAHLFTDSRYFIQAAQELDHNWILEKVGELNVKDWPEWLLTLPKESRIALDPSTITSSLGSSLAASLLQISFPPSKNLVDQIWPSRPPRTCNPIHLHPLKFAGVSSACKILALLKTLPSSEHSLLVSSLHAIAWVLNLRGSDIPYNPVFFSYLLLSSAPGGGAGGTLWIQNGEQGVSEEVRGYLVELGVEVREYERAEEELKGREKVITDSLVNYSLVLQIGSSNLTLIPYSSSPIALAQSIKNPTELQGLRNAYLRDGVAWAKWAAWLEEQIERKGREINEWDAGEKLTEFRKEGQYFAGLAYSNISATAGNAALPHYEPSKASSSIIDRETPYLNDSGAQYLDGTIDTTRTVHFGTPTSLQKLAFTRILQGHIAVDRLFWPEGTTGAMIDVVAKKNLWEEGMNYLHGTGHSVGSYLSVHDGTIVGIGASAAFQRNPLAPGHVMSNEPAFYLASSFGIRIESVLAVKPVHTRVGFGDRPWMGFERLTVVPIQSKMVDWKLMSKVEKTWLKDHNRLCRKKLEELVGGDERARKWLRRQ